MPARQHIVEELIAERAEHLSAHPAFPYLRPLLYRVLAYDAAVFLADAIRPLSGHEAFALVADHLRVRAQVEGLQNVPQTGAAFVVANHPTGLADGLAVYTALRERRPDMLFLANSDALRVIPGADDIIIPVEWKPDRRTRAKSKHTLLRLREAVEAGRLVVVFPSGRLAHLTWRGLTERPWESSAFAVAKRYGAPVVPLRIQASNSALFYTFSMIGRELRDITLFREMLNKKGRRFRLRFGTPIAPDAIPADADAAAEAVRARVLGRVRGR